MGAIYASIVAGKTASKPEEHLVWRKDNASPHFASQTRTSLGYSFCTSTGGQRPNETVISITPMRLAGKPVFHAGTVCTPRTSYNALQTNPTNERSTWLMVKTVARTLPAVYCSTSFARRRVVVHGAIADRVPKSEWGRFMMSERRLKKVAEWCQKGPAGFQSGYSRRCPSSQR